MFEALTGAMETVTVGAVVVRGLSVRQGLAVARLAGDAPDDAAGQAATVEWFLRRRALEVLTATGELGGDPAAMTPEQARDRADALLAQIGPARLDRLHAAVLAATRGTPEAFGAEQAAAWLRRAAERVEAEPGDEIRGALAGKIDPAALAIWLRHHAARLPALAANPAEAIDEAEHAAKKA